MSSEKSAEEIVFELFDKFYAPDFVRDGEIRDHEVQAVIDLVNKERAAKVERLSWPSDEEIAKASNVTARGYDPTWFDAIDWLRSQVKPFEMPVFSAEEIRDLALDYWQWADMENDERPSTVSFDSYITGFRKALELVRKRMGK